MINLENSYVVQPHIMSRQLDDETVILDMERGVYCGLNYVGTRIFDLLQEGHKLQDVIQILQAEYDVHKDVLITDIEELIQELLDKNLIRES